MSYDDVVLKLIEERDSMLENLHNNMVYTDCVLKPADDSGVVTEIVQQPEEEQQEQGTGTTEPEPQPQQQEIPPEQTEEESTTETTQPIFI